MEEKQTDQQQEQPISDDELLAQQAEEEQEIEEEEETAAAAPPQPQAPAEEKAADELPDPGFVHLHDHSDFSLLDGAAKIDRYVAKAKSYGMRSLALTDHGNMFGALRFYKACKEAGINPIIGCEFYCNPADHTFIPEPGDHNHDHRYHLILLAMNEKGYHNLMELNSAAWTEGFYYKPRIDDKLLEEHNEGLICLSACLAGEILQNLLGGQYEEAKRRALWFNSVFDDGRYYLEMQDHGLEEQKLTNPLLVKLHEETGIPLVCTNDIHYIEKDDAEAQDILLCIGTNSKRDDPNRMRFPSSEFYFKSPEEMKQLFSWCPEAIENTNRIAQRCDIQIHFPGPKLPVFQVPDGFKDTAEYLRYLANEGLKNRYGTITPQLQQRLDYELDIIIKMDFQGYFLIVMDYIRWAKNHGIPVGPGRGSGAGSLVAYSINITDVDPMKYNLLFERFLNPERVSMPDFDVDFCFERRKEVIQYVTEHYGKNRVAQIATFGTLKAKAVVKDCARVLDIPFDESTRICKLIPDDPKMTLAKAFAQNPELGQLEAKGGVYATLFSVARKLEGMNRNTSTHAAGVVIGQEPLVNYVPLYRDPKTGNQATQYTMDQIEECGLVKMDFLGLKTLTLIKHTVDLIHKKKPNFDINAIDDHDPKTVPDALQRGLHGGVPVRELRHAADPPAGPSGQHRGHRGIERVVPSRPDAVHPDVHQLQERQTTDPLPGPRPETGAGEHLRRDRLPGAGDEGRPGDRRLFAGTGGHPQAYHGQEESGEAGPRTADLRGRGPEAGPDQGARRRDLRDAQAVCRLRLQQEPRSGVLPGGLPDGVPQSQLPRRVPCGQPDQRDGQPGQVQRVPGSGQGNGSEDPAAGHQQE
jgi:DNA polymerase III alpha subunit (gram-positive type)